jgi:hypothetical protein
MLISTINTSFSQNVIEWNRDYLLQVSDFQSPTKESENGMYAIRAACLIDFSFYMSNYEFVFTKNFNSKAKTTFTKDASYIISPDSITTLRLLKYAQAEFDLAELHTRKFRKKMFESKNALSNGNFFQELYNEIQKEYIVRESDMLQVTEMGISEIRLDEYHSQILKEIDEYEDFCKDCKPKKKKK